MAFDIVGINNSYKRPVFGGLIVFGSGTVSAASLPMYLLLVGMRTSAGNLTLDSEIRAVTSADEAITAGGIGSQLHRMWLAAQKVAPDVPKYMLAVTESAGTAATTTSVISGTWTVAGEITLYIAGVAITVDIGAADAIDTVGANIVAKWNANADLPVTASYSPGTDTLTLTHRQLGAQGLDQIVYLDKAKAPAGFAMTLVGSAAVNGIGVRMGAAGTGTGTENNTVALTSTSLVGKRWARIASAANDTSNAARAEAFVNTQAGPTVIKLEQLIFGHNGSLGAATTLAQTDLNAQRAQVMAFRNCEAHPCEIAAANAALRAATEQTDPVPDYDGKVLTGLPPQRFDADVWTPAEENSLLNVGATPITTVNGESKIVRAITTYCLNGALQDERTLDIGDAVFPDYGLLDLQLLYETEFRPANKYVRDDPQNGEQEPPENVGTPSMWVSSVKKRYAEWFKEGWIEDTFSGDTPSLPVAGSFNKVAKRIQASTPLIVSRVQHQLLNTLRQVSQ